ncbi:hypothetical protein NE237_023285 [Protea cynaroides]|uniref:Uncharacterized protein n=1 Tax=Protea cynaroides TaxID=273540 RepID=A0A9Q0K507_9MAGN|nr:hypothetical protein NE237_023285 [Protea cynaroides]
MGSNFEGIGHVMIFCAECVGRQVTGLTSAVKTDYHESGLAARGSPSKVTSRSVFDLGVLDLRSHEALRAGFEPAQMVSVTDAGGETGIAVGDKKAAEAAGPAGDQSVAAIGSVESGFISRSVNAFDPGVPDLRTHVASIAVGSEPSYRSDRTNLMMVDSGGSSDLFLLVSGTGLVVAVDEGADPITGALVSSMACDALSHLEEETLKVFSNRESLSDAPKIAVSAGEVAEGDLYRGAMKKGVVQGALQGVGTVSWVL